MKSRHLTLSTLEKWKVRAKLSKYNLKSLSWINNLIIHLTAVLTSEPYHKFKLGISTEAFNPETDENGLCCQLVFTYTEKYPNTAPLVEIEDAVNFEDNYEDGLLEHIGETVIRHQDSGRFSLISCCVIRTDKWESWNWNDIFASKQCTGMAERAMGCSQARGSRSRRREAQRIRRSRTCMCSRLLFFIDWTKRWFFFWNRNVLREPA